ncbi:MAG: MarR family transcriptional regulator [Jatrophihabitans sp.]
MGTGLADARSLAAGINQLVLWLRRHTTPEFSSSTITALDRLRLEGPLRVSELAAREAISQPGSTLLVNRLADAGYAERVPDPTDGRASLVRITSTGEAVLRRREDQRAEALRERMEFLSETDRALITAALPAIERLVATDKDLGRKNR